MQPLGKYPYLNLSKRKIRKDAILQLLLSPVMFILCLISVVGIAFIPVFLVETFKELLIPGRLINKSKNELASDMEKDGFIKNFQKLSTKQREKYKV